MTTNARHRRTSVSGRLGLRATVGVGGTAGHGGVHAAAQRAGHARHAMSPGARAALEAYLPGTVLKAGSRQLADAEVWTLVLASDPHAPRLVKEATR